MRTRWRPAGWPRAGPVDEVTAEKEGIRGGLNSPQRVCSSHGLDYFEVVDELAEAKEYAKAKGVDIDVFVSELDKAADGQKPKLLEMLATGAKKNGEDSKKKRGYDAA